MKIICFRTRFGCLLCPCFIYYQDSKIKTLLPECSGSIRLTLDPTYLRLRQLLRLLWLTSYVECTIWPSFEKFLEISSLEFTWFTLKHLAMFLEKLKYNVIKNTENNLIKFVLSRKKTSEPIFDYLHLLRYVCLLVFVWNAN